MSTRDKQQRLTQGDHPFGHFPLWQVTLLVAAVVLGWRMKDFGLLGLDTIPIIASAEVRAPADVLRILTSRPADYVNYYRPVFVLTLSLDRAVWGLEPLGYQLTNLAAFVGCVAALGLTARRLLGPQGWLGTQVAVLAFLFFPSHFEVLPVPARRPELLVSAFALLAIWFQISPRAWERRRPPIMPALGALLSMGSKDNGLVFPIVCFVAVLACAPERKLAARLRRAAVAMLPHAIMLGAFFLVRHSVLQGIGGRFPPLEGLARYPQALVGMLSELIVPEPQLRPSALSGRLMMICAVAFGIVLAVRMGAARVRPHHEGGGQVKRTVLVALSWLAVTTLVYAARGPVQPWYILVLSVGWCLLAGACAQLLADEFRTGMPRVRWLASLAALAMLLALAWQSRHSPILRAYPEWKRASKSQAAYYATVAKRVETADPGSLVHVPPIPIPGLPPPTGPYATPVRSVSLQSLEYWARVNFPDRKLTFRKAAELRAAQPDETLVIVQPQPEAGDSR